jgi:hypothetical protein
MTDPTLAHQSFGLSGRALAVALFAKYVALAIYGSWAVFVEIPTFVVATSSFFAVGWAFAVAALAIAAAVGVGHTWVTGRYRLEKWTTAALIMVFIGYSFALLFRGLFTHDFDSLPLSIIPVALCTLPGIRYYSLVARHPRVLRQGDGV